MFFCRKSWSGWNHFLLGIKSPNDINVCSWIVQQIRFPSGSLLDFCITSLVTHFCASSYLIYRMLIPWCITFSLLTVLKNWFNNIWHFYSRKNDILTSLRAWTCPPVMWNLFRSIKSCFIRMSFPLPPLPLVWVVVGENLTQVIRLRVCHLNCWSMFAPCSIEKCFFMHRYHFPCWENFFFVGLSSIKHSCVVLTYECLVVC